MVSIESLRATNTRELARTPSASWSLIQIALGQWTGGIPAGSMPKLGAVHPPQAVMPAAYTTVLADVACNNACLKRDLPIMGILTAHTEH